jgi:hypothetical protein
VKGSETTAGAVSSPVLIQLFKNRLKSYFYLLILKHTYIDPTVWSGGLCMRLPLTSLPIGIRTPALTQSTLISIPSKRFWQNQYLQVAGTKFLSIFYSLSFLPIHETRLLNTGTWELPGSRGGLESLETSSAGLQLRSPLRAKADWPISLSADLVLGTPKLRHAILEWDGP